VVPADANQGVLPFLIWTLSRQYLGRFRPACPRSSLPNFLREPRPRSSEP